MFDDIVQALSEYEVVLEPDEDTPEWWAGAPSVVRADDGTFYLAARMREGISPPGKRGYEIRILRSEDGRRFEAINSITREAAGVPVFERPALVVDPATGLFRLYGCSGLEHGWTILRFDDVDDPAAFDAATARSVLAAEHVDSNFARVTGYKDPVVFWDGDQWRMFVIGCDAVERIHQFTSSQHTGVCPARTKTETFSYMPREGKRRRFPISVDGETWSPAGRVLENAGWHNFFTRPASVLPLAVGYLFVYEGSSIDWYDPVYNIATGLAYSPDLETFVDLTPDEPLLRSTTPGDYSTWRYSHWMRVGDEIFVYFEAARPNKTNEIRVGVFKARDNLGRSLT